MKEQDWKGKGVLVTGASGFVGGWLAKRLVELEARVVVLVRDADPLAFRVHPELWDNAIRVNGDITDEATVKRAISEYGVTIVFHLAAQAAVQSALADPTGTFDSNVKGTWTVLEACRTSGHVERIVVASSDKAYGDQPTLPYDEETSTLNGRYPYDASKAAADIITTSYAHTFDLPVAITRNANTYGGGDLSGHRLVPEAMMAIIQGRRPVIRSDGTPERDYLYVEDAVSGYLMLAQAMDRPELYGEAFNLGAEVGVRVIDLIQMILKVADSDMEPDIRGTASKEISRQYLSSQKAKRMLGWKPNYSLEEGLRKTWDWYSSRPELARFWSAV